VEPLFEEICLVDQDAFATKEGIDKLIKMIGVENARKDLAPKLLKIQGNSKEVWDTFTGYFEALRVQGNLPRKLKYVVEEVQLAMLYPRLDINVSKGFNHLLKSPFCVHPKTGKICVPFNPNLAFKFDPTTVPTIK
jgi:DNA primase small subunit